MIRITFKAFENQPETVVDYPACSTTMPFAGNDAMTAIVKDEIGGTTEVVAVVESDQIQKIEEVPDEG